MLGIRRVGQTSLRARKELCAVGGVQSRGMASLKDISIRIASTKSVQKITKSMKMVSAAKLRGDQERLENGKDFGKSVQTIFEKDTEKEDVAPTTGEKVMYVLISSDRGLCGGVNSFVSKEVKLAVDQDVKKGKEVKIFVIGEKGHGQVARSHGELLVGQLHEFWKTPVNLPKASLAADRILNAYGGSECSEIKIAYNKFVSAIKYDTLILSLPNYPLLASGEDESSVELPGKLSQYDMELESTEESLANLFEHGLSTSLYGCCLDSATSEQSARMQAMENASSNASELVEKLTIQYNRLRQAKITTELTEIVSGAEALNG